MVFWIWLQVLCALTLPIGNRVINYVEQNHKVSRDVNGSFHMNVAEPATCLTRTVLKERVTCMPFWFSSVWAGQTVDLHGKVLLCKTACVVWSCFGYRTGSSSKVQHQMKFLALPIGDLIEVRRFTWQAKANNQGNRVERLMNDVRSGSCRRSVWWACTDPGLGQIIWRRICSMTHLFCCRRFRYSIHR